MITKDEVFYLARLSRLSFTENEAEAMIDDIEALVSYFDNLNSFYLDGIEPKSHVFDIVNVMRDDNVKESMPRDEILSNSAKTNGESFIVPRAVK